MIIMAITTTLMGTPLFEWFYGRLRDELLARVANCSVGSNRLTSPPSQRPIIHIM